jgi:hypothetical protein
MSWVWTRPSHTIRPRLDRKTPVLLCVVIFGLTATIVYRWGRESWVPADAKPTYAATSYVVESGLKTAGGEVRIPIAYTDADGRHAEQAANALADRYVDDRHANWRRRTEGPCSMAREAVATARQKQAENEARLSEFQRELAEAAARPQPAAPVLEKPLPPPMIDNLDWLDLDRQLTDLERQRDRLLVDRTALHPAVQDVSARIDDLKRQMAAIPRQIPDMLSSTPKSEPTDEASKATEAVAANDRITEQDQRKLDDLTAAVETSRQAYQQAEAAEKQALSRQQAGPRYSVVYARAVEIPPTPDYSWRRLLWTTLVAGVLMAFGVGSVSTGSSIEPSAASVEQVRADTCAAVVGMVPADDPVADPAAVHRCQSQARRGMIAVGLILMVACPLAAIWGVLGL